MKSRESKREAWISLSLSPSLFLSMVWIRPKMRSLGRLDFFRLFIHETRGSRRTTCHVFFSPFLSRNNLFRPGFNFIYLKSTFFKYLIFFGIFPKSRFRGPFDACRLEFRENSIVSEFNEIRLGN